MTTPTAATPTAASEAEVSAAQLAVVRGLYQAFGRGDLPGVLDPLHEEVCWDADWADNFAQHTPVEHFLPRRGHAQVAEFLVVLAGYTLHTFEVQALMAGDGQVVAKILIDATDPRGGRFRDEELHLWTFGADGRVIALRHYLDTAKHLAAAAGQDTTLR